MLHLLLALLNDLLLLRLPCRALLFSLLPRRVLLVLALLVLLLDFLLALLAVVLRRLLRRLLLFLLLFLFLIPLVAITLSARVSADAYDQRGR